MHLFGIMCCIEVKYFVKIKNVNDRTNTAKHRFIIKVFQAIRLCNYTVDEPITLMLIVQIMLHGK